eukprot:1144971-Pelagomonas_calceolata.AAC.5
MSHLAFFSCPSVKGLDDGIKKKRKEKKRREEKGSARQKTPCALRKGSLTLLSKLSKGPTEGL